MGIKGSLPRDKDLNFVLSEEKGADRAGEGLVGGEEASVVNPSFSIF